jgi:hypothetical protein
MMACRCAGSQHSRLPATPQPERGPAGDAAAGAGAPDRCGVRNQPAADPGGGSAAALSACPVLLGRTTRCGSLDASRFFVQMERLRTLCKSCHDDGGCGTAQVMKSAVAAEGSRDQAAVIAVCCAAIAGLSALAVQHRSEPLHRCIRLLCMPVNPATCSRPFADPSHAGPHGSPFDQRI